VPFGAGWVGYLGYEARSGVEATPKPRVAPLGFPVLWLARAPASIAFDHASGRAYLSGLGADRAAAARAATRLWAAVLRTRPRASGTARMREPSARVSAAAYQARVARVRRHVRAGDIFQANLSQRFDAQGVGDPVALFLRLVASQPAPYMTFLSLPAGRALLSASPERF
jgi:para-aminobenzoate synthetase component 1